jgi:predicted ArsR family transcriptional regulator
METRKPRVATVEGVLGEQRTRLLGELCGQPQTAVDLAERVGISSNAVRVHLESMRSAGLVQYTVVRRGVGKPTHLFSVTPIAESLLSAAYVQVLDAVVGTLKTELNGGFVALLRRVGSQLATRMGGAARARPNPDVATKLLSALGAPATVSGRGAGRVLSSSCCPLAGVTRGTPEVCQLVESMLNAASGVQFRETCERGAHPRCRFVVADE